MLHWVESEDRRGFATWLRFVECSHWGLILTLETPRWFYGQSIWPPNARPI